MATPKFIPYGPNISLKKAKVLAQAAAEEAEANGWAVAIAIVDTAGELLYFERHEQTQKASITMAQDKAICAVTYKKSSKAFEDRVAAGTLRVLSMKGVCPVEGGICIMDGGAIIGAIGVSGAAAAEDGQVASRAIEKTQSVLSSL